MKSGKVPGFLAIWGASRTIDTFMRNLRLKVEDAPAAPKRLVTAPWSGYKFRK